MNKNLFKIDRIGLLICLITMFILCFVFLSSKLNKTDMLIISIIGLLVITFGVFLEKGFFGQYKDELRDSDGFVGSRVSMSTPFSSK
jgi:4-amino-4-deoxy-L-arabinose transferase-like glycosyltransferase